MSEIWRQIILPSGIFERIIGFSLPINEQVAVIAYDAIYLVKLDTQDEFVRDTLHPEGRDIYDEHRQLLAYHDQVFGILGLHGGNPLLESKYGESISIDKEQEVLRVQEKGGNIALEFTFEDFSGDWVCASFSKDSNFLLLGMPYDFYAFRRA